MPPSFLISKVDGNNCLKLNNFIHFMAGAIIGDGDRKRGVHAKPSKKTNVLFLAKIAPPSTSQTRAGTRKFAWGSVTRFKLGSKLDYMLSTKALIKLSL